MRLRPGAAARPVADQPQQRGRDVHGRAEQLLGRPAEDVPRGPARPPRRSGPPVAMRACRGARRLWLGQYHRGPPARGGRWPAVVPGGAYCATTMLDLADCGPGPALLMAWTVNR